MKVTDLTMTLFKWPVKPWRTGMTSFGGECNLGLITVKTDQGIEGHSFLGSSRETAENFAGPLMKLLKPAVMGKDPMDSNRLWEALYRQVRGAGPRAIGAVDCALWDAKGKAMGQPVHKILGTARESIPAYASSAWWDTPQQYVEEAQKFLSMGWTAYKTHPHAVAKDDIEICTALAKAVGDKMVLMLDAQWAFGFEDALRIGEAVQDLGFFWYEDPLYETDIYNYIKLKQKLRIPMLNTEFAPGGYYGMAPWIITQATDMLRGDVLVTGGITPLLRLAHLADGFRMKCEIHHGSNSLGNAANLNVSMAITNCDYYEVFPATGANKYGLVEDIEVDNKGLVHAPTKPGLGYDIDWALVKRDTVGVVK